MRGRKLKDGESYRKDGRYCYRYMDSNGKRKYLYDRDLAKLREKEKKLAQDLLDGILTDTAIQKLTLNDLFQRYVLTKQWEQTTLKNNLSLWQNLVKDSLGQYKIVQIKKSASNFAGNLVSNWCQTRF
ncbi:MAG: integrase DNA-binding domain-containing protein [Lachnospiraceae bacterium]|nr:integrase DNA-binding domain-containing protein [Lachnospiraceae bacterium]